MSAPVLWSCELAETINLTVGSKFHLKCSGTLPVQWSKKNITLELPQDVSPWALSAVQAVQLESTQLDLVVTSYVAGENKVKFVRVTDGDVAVESSELNWTVASVLKEGAQPYPPIGPFALSLPAVLIWMMVFVILGLVGSCFVFFQRRKKREQLEKDQEQFKSGLKPKDQFEKAIRLIRRSTNWSENMKQEDVLQKLQDLDQALRVLYMQIFNVKTLGERPQRFIVLALKEDQKKWKALFNELSRSQKDKEALLQLVESASKLVVRL